MKIYIGRTESLIWIRRGQATERNKFLLQKSNSYGRHKNIRRAMTLHFCHLSQGRTRNVMAILDIYQTGRITTISGSMLVLEPLNFVWVGKALLFWYL